MCEHMAWLAQMLPAYHCRDRCRVKSDGTVVGNSAAISEQQALVEWEMGRCERRMFHSNAVSAAQQQDVTLRD